MTPIACALVCAVTVAEWGPIRVDAEGVPLPPGVLARIGSTRMRHDGWLSEIHFTSDGRRILGIHNGNLSTWDARTGRRLRMDTLPGYLHRTSALRADGRLVFAAMFQNGTATTISLRTFDVKTGTFATVKTFEEGSPTPSSDGTLVAVRSNGYVRIYDAVTGKPAGETRLSISDFDPVKLVISPDNKRLAAAYAGWLEVREIATGNVAYSGTPSGTSCFHDAVFSPDGHELCCVVEKEKGFAVEAIELNTEKRVELTECRTFYFPTYSRDGQTLFGIRNSELVRIDRATKAVVSLGKGFSRATATPLVLSPDGSALAVGGIRCRLTLHDPKTGRRLPPTEDRFEGADSSIEFTADGTKLAFQSDSEDDAHLVDVISGRVLKTVAYRDASCRFLPNGTEYAVASADALEVRNVSNDSVRWKTAFKPTWVPAIRSTADGKVLFTVTENQIQTWEIGTRRPSDPYPNYLANYFLSSDGRFAIVHPFGLPNGAAYGVYLEDLGKRRLHSSWPKIEGDVTAARFDAANRTVALCPDRGGVLLVDLSTFAVRKSLADRRTGLRAPAFSNDSRMFAVADVEAQEICLCEASSGTIRQVIRVTDQTISMAFSPDGCSLAVHSTTAPVHLYDLRGKLLDLPKRLDRDSLAACWKALNGSDAKQAFDALRRFSAAPESTVPFIRDRVKSATMVPNDMVAALIESLDAPAFADREKATADLQRVADILETDLRAAEKTTPSAEVRQRLEKILASLRPESPESVRRSRIVEVVEWCGTPDAKKLLQEWAGGASTAVLTREAKEALARWKQ